MIQRLIERGERLAVEARKRTIDRLAAEIRAEARGLSVAVESAAVVIQGRGLLKRWLTEPALRFLGRSGR